MKFVYTLGGKREFFLLLEKLRQAGKICVKNLYELKTEFEQKRGWKYRTIVERHIYLAEVCSYLGFAPRNLAPHEKQEEVKKYGWCPEFEARCSASENKEMKPEICKKIWNGEPHRNLAIIYFEDRIRKEPLYEEG